MIKVKPKKTVAIYYRRIRVSFEGKTCKNNGEVKIERTPIVTRTRTTNQKFNAASSQTASVNDTSGKPCRGSRVDTESPPIETRRRREMANCDTEGIHRSPKSELRYGDTSLLHAYTCSKFRPRVRGRMKTIM